MMCSALVRSESSDLWYPDLVTQFRERELVKLIDTYKPLYGKIEAAIKLSATPDFALKDNLMDVLLQRINAAFANDSTLLYNDVASQGQLVPLLRTLVGNCSKLKKKLSLNF
ncbi:uncharacterized protein Dana_GF27343 [Drosophila ananassae]|uniref:Uncharacterized protein n=1 Tax=Drosophila ananassae TaxID=7217 RepID=A0A0P8Y0I5_DROAN|nr:uncharacterized protein Dana_GF27343 [Drosophila ananassae]